jgi:hypothetical protein
MYLPCVSFHLFLVLTARILLLFSWYGHLTAKQRTRIRYDMLLECGAPHVPTRLTTPQGLLDAHVTVKNCTTKYKVHYTGGIVDETSPLVRDSRDSRTKVGV